MPLDQKAIDNFKSKIKKRFGESQYQAFDPDIIDDFAKMAACLTPEIISRQLAKLSTTLENKLHKKGLIVTKDDSKSIKIKPGKNYVGNYHVLSEILKEWAEKNGFNQGGYVYCIDQDGSHPKREIIRLPSTMPIIIDILEPYDFRMLISLGYLFKDLGAPITHGEFSHIWQIYTIIEENKENKFLKHDPLVLYKLMGTKLYEGIWDIVFDSTEYENLNSPELLNDALIGGRLVREYKAKPILDSTRITDADLIEKQNWALSEALKGRTKKRLAQTRNYTISEHDLQKIEKTRRKEGLFIENQIYFEMEGGKRNIKFDDIRSECSYNPNLNSNYELPTVLESESIIDQLLFLFNSTNWSSKITYNQIDLTIAKRIYEYLKQIERNAKQAGDVFCFRDFINTVQKIKNEISPSVDVNSIQFIDCLINYSFGLLLKSDYTGLEPHQSQFNSSPSSIESITDNDNNRTHDKNSDEMNDIYFELRKLKYYSNLSKDQATKLLQDQSEGTYLLIPSPGVNANREIQLAYLNSGTVKFILFANYSAHQVLKAISKYPNLKTPLIIKKFNDATETRDVPCSAQSTNVTTMTNNNNDRLFNPKYKIDKNTYAKIVKKFGEEVTNVNTLLQSEYCNGNKPLTVELFKLVNFLRVTLKDFFSTADYISLSERITFLRHNLATIDKNLVTTNPGYNILMNILGRIEKKTAHLIPDKPFSLKK